MKRRDFVKAIPLSALLPVGLSALSGCEADSGSAKAVKVAGQASSGSSGTGEVPDWVKSMRDSDMVGLGPDGKPDPNYRANGSGHARENVDPNEPHEMTLTRQEQDIMDGKEGDAKAMVM